MSISVNEIKLFQTIPLFAGLSLRELELVGDESRRQSFAAGRYLFYEADPAARIYTLLSGRIKLTQVTPDGQQVILHYVTAGEAFAVVAVLSEVSYPVSAQAVEDSLVLSWDRDTMHHLMEQTPRIALNAVKILAE